MPLRWSLRWPSRSVPGDVVRRRWQGLGAKACCCVRDNQKTIRGEHVTLQTFSTDHLPPRQRIQYWNDLCAEALTPLTSDPLDRDTFTARLARVDLGPIRLSEVHSAAAVVRHSSRHVVLAREQLYLMCLQLTGTAGFCQNGREAVLQKGDFTLLDSRLPYEVTTDKAHELLVLGFRQQVLRRYVAHPEAVLAVRMPGQTDLSGLASSFIRDFWRQYRDRLGPQLLPRISAAILDLAGSAYSLVPQAQAVGSAPAVMWRVRIRDHIEAHLYDPELTPMRIAAKLGISPRYLHQLFDDGEETLARYIQQRRLEECARTLADSSQRGRTVAEIALSHGFNNPSHFGRVFRSRYQATPREYRSVPERLKQLRTVQN